MKRNMETVTIVNLRAQASSEITFSNCLETLLQQRPNPAWMGTFSSSLTFNNREQHVPLQIWNDPMESLLKGGDLGPRFEELGLLNEGGFPFVTTEERLLLLKCCNTSSPAIPMLDRLRFSKLSSALLRLTLERRRWRRMLGFLIFARPSVSKRCRVRV